MHGIVFKALWPSCNINIGIEFYLYSFTFNFKFTYISYFIYVSNVCPEQKVTISFDKILLFVHVEAYICHYHQVRYCTPVHSDLPFRQFYRLKQIKRSCIWLKKGIGTFNKLMSESKPSKECKLEKSNKFWNYK